MSDKHHQKATVQDSIAHHVGGEGFYGSTTVGSGDTWITVLGLFIFGESIHNLNQMIYQASVCNQFGMVNILLCRWCTHTHTHTHIPF